MTKADLVAFARRDWAALEDEKTRTWRTRKLSLGVEGAFAWPTSCADRPWRGSGKA